MSKAAQDDKAPTGIHGLDDILRGGLPRNRLYLVQGDPGSGKTTLGLQFLLEGRRIGETGLYISLSETTEEINAVAASHGWSLDGVHIIEMTAAEQQLTLEDDNTLFEPSEVELRELMQRLLGHVERTGASRVVLDSLSEMRLLAQTSLRYRRQVLVLKQFFAGRNCTVLMLDDRTTADDERQLQSLAHGVLSLENRVMDYGNERRRLRVVKLRGVQPRGGYHELVIMTGGLRVFPRLVAAEHRPDLRRETISSGVSELDEIVGGGIDRGTATLIMGPAGSGKSTLALRFALAAVARGERVALFAFDERLDTILARFDGLGMDLRPHLGSGAIKIRQIDPAEMGPGEFTALVADAHGLLLTFADDDSALLVDADVVRLEQVVTNLVTNALKYTPRGGGIDVRVSREGDAAVVTVRDTGVGIAPEHLPAIFDLFAQAPTGLDRARGGLGLGLTLVRSLVELLGGTVSADSAGEGQGSTFTVRLPALEPAAADGVTIEDGRVAARTVAHERVVVVDDNVEVREALTELLELVGYVVEAAGDGPQGLTRIMSSRPSAALVDIGLPGFDGYELARRARSAFGESLVLVAMTGYGQAEDRARAAEAGFDAHITKPVSLEDVQAALGRPRAKIPGAPAA